MTLSRLSALSSLSSLSGLNNSKLQSVLAKLDPGEVLGSVVPDNGTALAAPTFLNYDKLTGVVTFSVAGATTYVNASDIQVITLATP